MKRALLLLVAITSPLLLGIASCPEKQSMDYQALWNAYLVACQRPENQNILNVKDEKGRVLYSENKGCVIPEPPKPFKQRTIHDYILAYGQVMVPGFVGYRQVEMQERVGIHSATERRKIIEAFTAAIGNRAGGDILIGDDESVISPDNSDNSDHSQ